MKHYFSYDDKNSIFSAVNAPLWFLQRMWLDLEAKYNLYFYINNPINHADDGSGVGQLSYDREFLYEYNSDNYPVKITTDDAYYECTIKYISTR